MDLANHFAELIRRENILELYVEPSLSLVCFRWAGRGEEDQQNPFDLAALYVADRKHLLDALSLQPEYLRNAHSESGAVVDFEVRRHAMNPANRFN